MWAAAAAQKITWFQKLFQKLGGGKRTGAAQQLKNTEAKHVRRPGSHPQPQRRPAPVREPALATEPVTPVEALHRMEAPRADQHKVAVGELDRAPGGQYVWWVSHVSSPGGQRRCSLHRQRRRIALHRSSLGSSEALLTPTQRHASPEPERPEPAEASQWPEPAEAPCGEPLG